MSFPFGVGVMGKFFLDGLTPGCCLFYVNPPMSEANIVSTEVQVLQRKKIASQETSKLSLLCKLSQRGGNSLI